MKKLLVTVIGATAAIGAFAATPVTALRFESATPGETKTATELNTLHEGTYWSDTGSADSAYVIEAAGSVTSPMPLGNVTKSLNVKTKFGNPLSVNVVDGGEAQTIGADGIYFDSLVKFTVCDDAPSTNQYEGAKIVMWLQEDEAAGKTNLYVNAGFLSCDNQGRIAVSNAIYKCGTTIGSDFADNWHRVTIKAIANITTSTETQVQGFAIFIDGSVTEATKAACTSAKWDSSFTDTFEFAEAVEQLKTNALFPSLIQQANGLTLSKASFDGTGSITDIAFYDESPAAFADDYVAPKATITIGENVETFTSLEDAIDAVNGESAGTKVELALMRDMTLSDTLAFNSPANVIFDFAGYVLTNNGNTPAISNAGTLTITNSTDEVGGIVCTGAGAAVSQAGTGALVIGGGVFNGDVDFAEALDVTVTGGSFKNDETYFETEERTSGTWIADGMKLKLNQTTGFYDVVIDGVASIGDTEYATLKDAVDAAQAGDTVTVLKDCAVTEPITFSAGIVVSNDYTVTLSAAYALRFANGTASPVTFCGTGAFEQPSGVAGSPILIGNNEDKTSYSMPSTFEGSLVLNSGNITILHAKNNVIKVEKGSFVMNGGTLSGGKCGVKADSEHGDATTTVTINGGVVSNLTAAVATVVAGSGSATVTIADGEITGPLSKGANTTLTIPGTSTAQFDRDQTAFCVADYKTVQSGDWYVVTAKVYYTAVSLNKNATSIETNLTEMLTATFTPASTADDTYIWASSAPAVAAVDQNGVVTAIAEGTATITVTATHDSSVTASCTVTVTATAPTPVEPTIDPETNTPVEVAAETAADAKEAVKITPPATSGADAAAYKALFNLKAESAGEGKFNVSIDSIKDSVEQSVAVSAEELVSGSDATGTITIPAGLYYKVTPSAGLPISGTPVKGLSDGTTTTITKPTGTQGFIKVEIGTAEYK